jgi:hypothetical protein
MTPRTIRLVHVAPPIPVYSCDWLAVYEGEEEDGPRGWGETPETALADLLDHEE